MMAHRVFRTLLLALLLPAVLHAAPLKVVCWNLEWFPGGKPGAKSGEQREYMKKAQAALKLLNPDILCVQEVKDWKAVQELTSVLPGLNVQVVSRFKGSQQQQGIASRIPADSAWSEEWDATKGIDVPRGYAFAALKMPGGGYLLVYSVHLKANGRSELSGNIAKREESARQLIAHAAEMQKIYSARGPVAFLITGDMNTNFDPGEFSQEKTLRNMVAAGFHSTWDGVPAEQRQTHPASDGFPAVTFDHILTAGLGNITATVGDGTGVSDHMPVLLTISEPFSPMAIDPTAKAADVAAAVEAAPTDAKASAEAKETAPSTPTEGEKSGATVATVGGSIVLEEPSITFDVPGKDNPNSTPSPTPTPEEGAEATPVPAATP